MYFRFTNIVFILLITLNSKNVIAQPMGSSSIVVEGEKLYRDSKINNLWYYLPPAYQLLTDIDGKPSFSLMQMRYTGTTATGDRGVNKYNNLVQFRVVVNMEHTRHINMVKTGLKRSYPAAELRIMPVRKFSSLLVFAGSDAGAADTTHLVRSGYAEPVDENAEVNNSYWNERVITFRINNFDAQLVESALKNNQAVMSFSYAFFTNLSNKGNEDTSFYVNGRLQKATSDYFAQQESNGKDTTSILTMIKADAIPLRVDVQRWPTAIQQTDINERVPAKYALLDVYCYDFNNELRPDLYAKKVEIKASSVNGSDITTTFSFRQNKPDVYAKSIRFAYAVKFDKPYYYRVTEITNEGEALVSEWKQKTEWSQVLDITSPPDKVIHKIKEDDN
ncbi:MAG: hypothetical protein ABIR18_11285 [Chitinophagaceae bacterium]